MEFHTGSFNIFLFLAKKRCPRGYKELPGTFRGNTLGEMEKHLRLDQCAEICDQEILCKSFEYDKKSKSCKINHAVQPDDEKKFYGFFFCQKQSKTKQLTIDLAL